MLVRVPCKATTDGRLSKAPEKGKSNPELMTHQVYCVISF